MACIEYDRQKVHPVTEEDFLSIPNIFLWSVLPDEHVKYRPSAWRVRGAICVNEVAKRRPPTMSASPARPPAPHPGLVACRLLKVNVILTFRSLGLIASLYGSGCLNASNIFLRRFFLQHANAPLSGGRGGQRSSIVVVVGCLLRV